MSDRTLYREAEGTRPDERWPLMEALYRSVLVPVEPAMIVNADDIAILGLPDGTYAIVEVDDD